MICRLCARAAERRRAVLAAIWALERTGPKWVGWERPVWKSIRRRAVGLDSVKGYEGGEGIVLCAERVEGLGW